MITSKLKSILLVDDDESTHFLNKIFISKLDLEIDVGVALNGNEALDIIANRGPFNGDDLFLLPCLLILDIRMPQMDGWQFLESYEKEFGKDITDNITIVMVTISEDEQDMVKASNNLHIKEFLHKPLSDIKFQNLIEKYFSPVGA